MHWKAHLLWIWSCYVHVATFYVNISGGNQQAIEYTSLSIAFITFMGILFLSHFPAVEAHRGLEEGP